MCGVTDFGLARPHQQESDLTQTGDVVGTLRYLPPEAINGQWDERSDVYSLGLTIYELLTLQPAFGQRDRTKLLDDIARGEPQQPRRINSVIPWDLETIVLKAAARLPADRYQTAGALADDIQRYQQGKPITARRMGFLVRAFKWSRRHPAVATLIMVVALLVLVGLPGVTTLWRRAETALAAADFERGRADQQRDRAESLVYARSLSLAQSHLEALRPVEARKLLADWEAGRGMTRETTESPRRDRRGWEWNYLHQQLDTSLMTLAGHSGPVLCVAIHPDDTQIASVGGWEPRVRTTRPAGEVILWNAETGQQQHVLRGHQTGTSAAAYSPDGRRLATISIGNERAAPAAFESGTPKAGCCCTRSRDLAAFPRSRYGRTTNRCWPAFSSARMGAGSSRGRCRLKCDVPTRTSWYGKHGAETRPCCPTHPAC